MKRFKVPFGLIGIASGITGFTLLNVGLAYGEETFSFPMRLADFRAGEYVTLREFSEGCCIFDLNISKFVSGNWTGYIKGTGKANNNQRDWGVPLYAPANGKISSCWRSSPDDPATGEDHPDSDKIFTGGNHVIILTNEGKSFTLAHLRSNSIPNTVRLVPCQC